MNPQSNLPPSNTAAYSLLLVALLLFISISVIASTPGFVLIGRSGATVTFTHFQLSTSGELSPVTSTSSSDILFPDPKGRRIADAFYSPGQRWLALGLGRSGYEFGGGGNLNVVRVVILETRSKRLLFSHKTFGYQTGSWAIWENENTLFYHVGLEDPDETEFEFQGYAVTAPEWTISERKKEAPLADAIPVRLASKRALSGAIATLTKLGYVMEYDQAEYGGMRPRDLDWNDAKLGGYTGAVSKDGRAIATLVDTELNGHSIVRTQVDLETQRRIFVVLQRSRGWEEQALPEERRIERVQFWQDYLVVSTTNRERDRFLVTLWKLNDLSKALEVEADCFLPDGMTHATSRNRPPDPPAVP